MQRQRLLYFFGWVFIVLGPLNIALGIFDITLHQSSLFNNIGSIIIGVVFLAVGIWQAALFRPDGDA